MEITCNIKSLLQPGKIRPRTRWQDDVLKDIKNNEDKILDSTGEGQEEME
jgi:hypothetical protein